MSYDSFEGVDVPALSQAVLSYLQGYEVFAASIHVLTRCEGMQERALPATPSD